MENLQLVCSDGRATNLCKESFNGYDLSKAMTPIVLGQHHPPVGLAVRAIEATGIVTNVALRFQEGGYAWAATEAESAFPSVVPVKEISGDLRQPIKGIQCLFSRSSGVVNVRTHT